MEHPNRKNIRLKDYDYSQAGAYFVTICTENRSKILSNIVGGGFHAAPRLELTAAGHELEECIHFLNRRYSDALFDKYVIMPNHLHCIIVLQKGGYGSPPLHEIIKLMKSYTTKRYNELCNADMKKLWQRNYYEHVIRNETDYLEIWKYIDENPQKWIEDEYY